MEITQTGELKLSAPVCNEEIEKSVLGIILTEKDIFPLHRRRLHAGMFYNPRNAEVFSVVDALFNRGKDIDLLTVVDEIRRLKDPKTDAYYCTVLTNQAAGSAHFETWIAILQQDYIMREITKISAWAYYSSLDLENDALDLFSKMQSKITGIISNNFFKREKLFADILKETVADMRIASEEKGGVIGLPTGDSFIDNNIKGLVPPDLTIIAARPNEGKTTLAWNLVMNVARMGTPVGFFSYEMKDRQLMWKTLSHYLPETVNKIRSGELELKTWERLSNQYNDIAGLPIYLNDNGGINVDEMKAIISSWIAKYGVKCVFIDYLQLVPPVPELRKSIREVQVSHNSRSIKSMCMEFDIPIILLSQLSRQGANVEPELHHLRESGAIEQDADNVIFLHRNEEETNRYYPGWQEGDPEWISTFSLKKCRLGSKGVRNKIMNAAYNTFRDVEFISGEPF